MSDLATGLLVGGTRHGEDAYRLGISARYTYVQLPTRGAIIPDDRNSEPRLKQRLTSDIYHKRSDSYGQVFWLHESLLIS